MTTSHWGKSCAGMSMTCLKRCTNVLWSLSLFHLFPFLFYSFCVFTFFFVYVCFMFLFFLFLFCLSSFFKIFMYLFIYLFNFYFLFQKDCSFFNMFYNENNFFFNCIYVWLDAGPPVFPKDFFNRNGTSRGPLQQLPWPPCPALFVISSTGTGSD
jgi:hypothetical protein